MPKHPTSNEFGWLLRDIRLAFRRKDCAKARTLVNSLLLRAKTPAQQETTYRLQNAVRKCKFRDLEGTRSRKRRRRK